MAFDNPTRNRLQRLVSDCRGLLTKEFDSKLQEIYGIYADEGRVLDLEKLPHLDDQRLRVATLLRERVNYLAASGGGTETAVTNAVRRVLREQAFTVLNRFVALRMAEERGIIVESVGNGFNSKAFKTFSEVAFSGLGDSYQRYRVFLFCLFDEMSTDLGVLFDRASPYGLLFPRQEVLLQLFDLLNDPDIKSLWQEDETVGWIYQYFNDPSERKKMREESAAPRNSRELAVRNQFFTPRYVVEFLTDNTLGRIWYEMTRGQTRLTEQCYYLVRRPNEIFLKVEESAPEPAKQDGVSQQELLKQPLHIPHRPLKDPRTILMLDPACGSMHFGLYAFDLFEVIYNEAWDLQEKFGSDALSRSPELKSLHDTYPNKDAFLKDVPRLIIERNIHGIDIDPRCAQIAGLSLWLRAQKAWQTLGVKTADRPSIKRSNIVCAEPMPGDKEFLREFVEKEFSATERGVFHRLLETVFDKMQLAGEAGTLLRIEEEIITAITEAKKLWRERPQLGQSKLFTEGEPPKQDNLKIDLTGITDEEFWDGAESRIYNALRDYAEHAENGGGFQRRLFAEDAARGFAFIDLCRQRYDVALMNPPFGDASLPSKPYIEDTYGDTKGDVYKAFVECFHARLSPSGYLGIISSRTGFFLGLSEDWRTRVVLRLFRPVALADLGGGVLDAMVEVAAYILRNLSESESRDLTFSLVPVLKTVVRDKQDRFSLPRWQAVRGNLKRHQAVAELEHLETHGFISRCPGDIVRYTPIWDAVNKITAPPKPVFQPIVCVRATANSDKGNVLRKAVDGSVDGRAFISNVTDFQRLPGCSFAYWVSPKVFELYERLQLVEGYGWKFTKGLASTGDARFVRLAWETPAFDRDAGWKLFAKGGAFSRFYSDIYLKVRWFRDGIELKEFLDSKIGEPNQWSRWINAVDYYFRPGLTWSRRSQRGLSLRALPAGCIFADKGPGVFEEHDNPERLLGMLALTNSAPFNGLVALQMAFGSFEVGVLQRTVLPDISEAVKEGIHIRSLAAWSIKRHLDTTESTSNAFTLPGVLTVFHSTLTDRALEWTTSLRKSEEAVATIQAEIDDISFRLYGIEAADRTALTTTLCAQDAEAHDISTDEDQEEETVSANASELTADLLAYAVGCALGRWDIRLATGTRPKPEPPSPFDPLPVCSPGMLQNALGLPAASDDVPPEYPLRINWSGILVDDEQNNDDIERRVRDVLAVLFPSRADAIADEADTLLGVKSLREWFRKPTGFFSSHLKRYSKTRRQAPIYWPLSTASGNYTLWIYYQRLTDQTLFQCVNEFVKPKIVEVEADLSRFTGNGADKPGVRAEIERLTNLRAELIEFRDELLRAAQLPYKPNLNDGVLVTACPLWKLFRLPKWQKDLKACWESFSKGEYDWAHLALSIWPQRVKDACKKDRSIAIAHDLEDLCEIKLPEKKGNQRKKKQEAELAMNQE